MRELLRRAVFAGDNLESDSQPVSFASPDPGNHWRRHRRRSIWRWWLFLLLAVAAGGLFAFNFDHGDTAAEVMLAAISLLAMRGAWRADRQIRACDSALRELGK
jgi:hypothetical protein